MQLYNKLSAIERAALIDEAGKDRITISFYQYFKIENPQLLRDKLFLEWDALEVLGRIYVSFEGINAQLSVASENFYALKAQLDAIIFLKDIRLNVAVEHNNKSFLKLKVKVRNKIVADGLVDETFDEEDPSTKTSGICSGIVSLLFKRYRVQQRIQYLAETGFKLRDYSLHKLFITVIY